MRYLKTYRDFSGGLSESANDNMPDNCLSQAMNIIPGDGFGLARCSGVRPALPRVETANPQARVNFITQLTLADGSVQTLLFLLAGEGDQRLYCLNDAADGWLQLAAQLPRTLDIFLQAHQLLWLTGQQILRYDGAAVSELPFSPEGEEASEIELAVWQRVRHSTAVEQRGQRWFYATPDNEVIFSEVGDPAAVRATNIINIATKDDDQITALHEFNNGLLVFKRRSVFYLSGWDFANGSDITLTRLSVTQGTSFPQSVQRVENAVLYLGMNGVYRLYVPTMSTLVAAENIAEHKVSQALRELGEPLSAWATVWDNKYRLALIYPDDAATVREFRFYPDLNAFFGPFTHQPTCYAVLNDGQLYQGQRNGWVVVADETCYRYWDAKNSAPQAIPIYAVTKGFDVSGQMARQVKLKKVLIAARQYLEESSRLTLRIKADYSDVQYSLAAMSLDESLVWGEGEYGSTFWGWKDTVTKSLPVNCKAQRLTVHLSDATIDEPALVYGLAVLYRPGKVKGDRAGVNRVPVDYE